MIDLNGVTKRFGPHKALTEIDLHVEAGECILVVGPNGAGKTTLLRTVAGLVRPTHGRICISGRDLTSAHPSLRQQIGYLSHRSLLYEDLTAEQNLTFYARLYGIPNPGFRIAALLDQVDLTARRTERVGTFARGMKQRLAIARVILHHPNLLLLDEPYTGLDPLAADIMNELLVDLSMVGCTQLISTHKPDVPAFGTMDARIVMLKHGQIVYDGAHDVNFAERYRAWLSGNHPLPASNRSPSSSADRSPEEGPTQPAPGSGSGIGTHVWAILSKDLTTELHTREIISAMVVFAILALFIFSVTLDLRGSLARAAAPGVLWSTIAFTGMLGLSRSLVREYQTGGIEGVRAAPVDPVAIFLGKALGAMVLMLLVELVLVPLTVALLNVPLVNGALMLTLILGTLGYASVGTLLSAIAVNTRAREVMLPILLLPIILPLFLSAVQTTRGLLEGSTWTELGGWTQILIVYDLIIVAISVILFRYTLEE